MNWQKEARELLKTMTATQLRHGMAAFGPSIIPGTANRQTWSASLYCFLGCAFRDEDTTEGLVHGMVRGHGRGFELLEHIFENWRCQYPHEGDADWLRSECIRELAERGEAHEPVALLALA